MANFTFKDAAATTKTGRSATFNGVEIPASGLVDFPRTIVGYGFDDAMAAAQGLPNVAAMVTAGATHALVSVEGTTGGIRYRQDGNSPSATPTSHADAGLLVPVGSAAVFVAPPGGDLSTVKVIETDTGVVVVVEYFKVDA